MESVYIVDDGSTDQTFREAKRAGANIIRHPKNRGKGAALKTGFVNIIDHGHAAVTVLDADGQHLPEEIPKFIEKFNEGYKFVMGRRDFKSPDVPLHRKIGNLSYSYLLSLVSGQKIYDSECGFRLYNADFLPQLINISALNGFSYESELLFKLAKSKTKIGWADISTIYFPARVSKIKPLKHLLDCAKVVTRI